MSHFQRVQYQIAPHYLHSYPSAPRGVHPVMPLMPMMPYTYGSADYGIALDQIVGHYVPEWAGGRKSIETLRKQNSNTAVYAAYDNIRDLDAVVPREYSRQYKPGMSDVTIISTWPDMAGTVAASDSAAVLKTSYLLMLAGYVLGDLDLVMGAKASAEEGVKKGEGAGSAKKTSNITSIYTNAVEKLQASKGYKSKGSGSPQVQTILAALTAGTGQKAVEARVKTYRKEQEDLKDELPQNEGGNKPNPPCDDTWKSYIPGLCTAEQTGDTISWGVKVTAGLLTVAVVAWGASKVIKSTRAARSNPSAPGRTDSGPEEDIASMPKAREQETRMNKHVFKRNA